MKGKHLRTVGKPLNKTEREACFVSAQTICLAGCDAPGCQRPGLCDACITQALGFLVKATEFVEATPHKGDTGRKEDT